MVDKRIDKVSRINTFIDGMNDEEETKITPMAKIIGMHPNTLREKLDEYQSFMDAGGKNIKIIRNKNKKGMISRLQKVNKDEENLNFKKEIRNLLLNINNRVDELSNKVKK